MIREIKYRIWSNDYNKYIESYANTHEETFGEGRYGYEGYHLALRPNGKLYDADVGIDYPGTLSEIPTLNWEDESENNEVEMSTGLKDKNGKEIYEGDIVKARWYRAKNARLDTKGEVKFADGWFYIDDDPDGQDRLGVPVHNCYSIEVIGNIHENPELLEKGEENE